MGRVFVGHDWAEAHHDVFVEDEHGGRLERARLPAADVEDQARDVFEMLDGRGEVDAALAAVRRIG